MTDSSEEPILYILDFNVGNETDDPANPYNAGRIAIGLPNSSTTSTPLKTLKPHELRPDGIEVLLNDDSTGGRIFYTQMSIPTLNDGIVQSCDLAGNDVRDVFAKGEIHTPKQVAIDRVHGKVYVCDREGLRVHRANLDGSDKEVLIQTGDWTKHEEMTDSTRWCVGVCVDPSTGWFYWTQKGPSKGGKGKILRARMEIPAGTTASTRTDIEVLFENLPEPIDLQISPSTQQLYWTDRGDFPKGNTLNRVNITGGNVAQIQERGYEILARHLHEAIGLQVDERGGHIYVSDMGGDVYRYDLEGREGLKMFEGQGVFTGLAVAWLGRKVRRGLYGF